MKHNRYKEVIELYKSGISDTRVIAETLGITNGTVSKHLNDAIKIGDIVPQQSLYEQVIEQYNSGVTDIKQIAINTKGNERTISNYISEAKKEGRIKKINSYKSTIEMCNTTDYSLQEIAEKLNLSTATVRQYYQKGRKQQKVQRKVKSSNKTKVSLYDRAVKLKQEGMENDEIAIQLKITEGQVEKFLIKYSIEQRKQIYNEEYDAVLKLLRNNIFSVDEISRITGITEREVRRYIKTAKNKNDIEIENNYEQVVKLYNDGITSCEELKNRIGIKEKTISAYIHRAKAEGKIKQNLSAKQIIQEQYDMGNTSAKQIEKATGISRNIVERYVSEYEKEYEKKRNKLINQNILSENSMQKVQEKYGLKSELIFKIDSMLKKKYPYEIAKELMISPQIVYDIIDGMNKAERTRMMECFLINNSVYKKVSAMRKHGVPVSEAIEKAKARLKGLGLVELADLYYVLEQESEAERTLNIVIYGDNYSQALKEIAVKKQEKIKQEFKNQGIRDFYKRNLKDYRTKTSYDVLCKRFAVRVSLIIELLGKEEICL